MQADDTADRSLRPILMACAGVRRAPRAGHRVETRVLTLDAVPRALVERDTAGLCRNVAEEGFGKVLGLHLLARGAGEVILAGTYAIKANMTVTQLAEVGVTSVVAVSGDDEEPATASRDEWGLGRLAVGYGQHVASVREWGLYVSKGIKEGEPELFGEPGLFVISPDGSLYAAVLNTMPFGRPHIDEIVGAIRYVNVHDYPARGEA